MEVTPCPRDTEWEEAAMRMRVDLTAAAADILRRIEAAGYATSVHHMRRYVELHAVHLSGDHIPHVARAEGDGEQELYLAARALAQMVRLRALE
jgi:hypothetical protein